MGRYPTGSPVGPLRIGPWTTPRRLAFSRALLQVRPWWQRQMSRRLSTPRSGSALLVWVPWGTMAARWADIRRLTCSYWSK
jgi:hypothetical protein